MAIPHISIVIPIYNEAENIRPLVQELTQSPPLPCSFELIFVDDASTDTSSQEIKACREILSSVYTLIYVKHLHRQGQSAALRSGIRQASHPWIITLDGDGQNDPADIQVMLTKLADLPPKTVLFGTRRKRQDTYARRLTSRMANGIRQFILKDNSIDTGCSLKLFPRQAFLDLPFFDHIHRFLPPLFQYAGYRIINVPVNHRHRSRGTSKYTFWGRLGEGIIDLIGVLWLKKRMIAEKETTPEFLK